MRCFIDSNIFLYAIDDAEREKQLKAQKLLLDLRMRGECFVFTQVVQEFVNIATKKLGFQKSDVLNLSQIFSRFCIHDNSFENILDAQRISIKTQFSFWDSLIISAAKSTKCSILYSEDLNDGQIVDSVKIVNPFCQ